MNTVEFRNKKYPEFITNGNHAQFILPVAKHVLAGKRLGVDIGCNRVEWSFPGSIPIDLTIEDSYHAMDLPHVGELEYIFSSHCLEHLYDWQAVLEYWAACLKTKGIMFLYLPHLDCEYWDVRYMPTKRHVNNLKAEVIAYELEILGFKDVFYSKRDAAYSFSVYGEKQ